MKYLKNINEMNSDGPNIEEIEDLCRKFFNKNKNSTFDYLFEYSIQPDGKIFVPPQREVNIDDFSLTKLPFTFNETIDGNIYIVGAYNLTTLEGLPTESIGILALRRIPNLKTLRGGPRKVDVFTINGTGITNLVGGPRVATLYSCRENQLTSLEGCPEELEGINCSKNPLTNLKGVAKKISNFLDVSACHNLTSLEGMAKMIEGRLNLRECYNLYDPSPLRGSSFRELNLFRCPILSLYNLFHKNGLSNVENIKNFIDSLDYNYIRVFPDSRQVFLNYFRLNEALKELDIPISTVRDIPNFAYTIVDDRGWPVEIKPDWDERPPHL